MQDLANALLLIIIGTFILLFIEATYAYYKGNFNFRTMDTISSLSAGMTNAIKNVLGLTAVIIGYKYMFENWSLVDQEVTWITYLLALIGLDFATYWYHRLAHNVNIFWNRHVIHHSGEEFNIATALRQSISKFVNISVFFLLPAALMGVPPKVIAIVTPLFLFVQVWYHTIHIGKLGWLEYIIVTPSQHRVHHAINKIYMDKNMSPVFCIWDRMFGTFQEELDEEPCVYGVSRQVNTWNPIKINLGHLWLLIRDAWYAESWWDKMRIWFMPTGWRPEDVEEKYPVVFADPKNFVKYDPQVSTGLKGWSFFQFSIMLAMVFHLLFKLSEIGYPGIFIYGIFMFLMIYSYTTLMDKDPNAVWLEGIKSFLGLLIIYQTGTWFSIEQLIPGGTIIVAAYFIISAIAVAYFVAKEIGWSNEDDQLEKAIVQ
ncbi:MAG: alkylglycerol monooxygenase [Saprospiraceae bacterium]|jgi:alkylglycerol monooxygenase